jgi:hypothetical protein
MPDWQLLQGKWSLGVCALHARLLLQCDGFVGRVWRLRRGTLLSGRVDVGDAVDLSRWLVLFGAECHCDAMHGRVLLQFDRADGTDRHLLVWSPLPAGLDSSRRERLVRPRFLLSGGIESRCVHCGLFLPRCRHSSRIARWTMQCWILLSCGFVVRDAACMHGGIILRNVWARLALGFMQRRLLLRRRLVDRDTALVRDWHLLSDWQHQHDHLSAWRDLPCARAGQLHAESDRQL